MESKIEIFWWVWVILAANFLYVKNHIAEHRDRLEKSSKIDLGKVVF